MVTNYYKQCTPLWAWGEGAIPSNVINWKYNRIVEENIL